MSRTFLKYWVPVVLWSLLILWLSGATLRSERTSSSLEGAFSFLGVTISLLTFELIHTLIRRMGHLVEYGILSFLAFRAIRKERRGFRPAWGFASVGLCTAVAGLDEFRQSFAPGRTALFADVVLDVAGATIVQLVLALRFHSAGRGHGDEKNSRVEARSSVSQIPPSP